MFSDQIILELRGNLAEREGMVAEISARIAELSVRLEQLQEYERRSTIRAPVDGTVTHLAYLHPGSMLDATAPAVILAPDGGHMVVTRSGHLQLEDSPPVDGHRPSGTKLLDSLARCYGRNAMGVVLTGMGCDGASGLAAMNRSSGITIAQDEASGPAEGCPEHGPPRDACALRSSPLALARHRRPPSGVSRSVSGRGSVAVQELGAVDQRPGHIDEGLATPDPRAVRQVKTGAF